MIQIILSDERQVDPADDPLCRDRIGYSPTMSPGALYDANHGYWVLGERAQHERFALFTHAGTVHQAIEIDHIQKITVEGLGERGVIHGKVLTPGHPVHDAYVGRPAPNASVRNPITYFRSVVGGDRLCRCGCGEVAGERPFLQGHDQTALHDRVKQIGTVVDFLDWFDGLAAPLMRPNRDRA